MLYEVRVRSCAHPQGLVLRQLDDVTTAWSIYFLACGEAAEAAAEAADRGDDDVMCVELRRRGQTIEQTWHTIHADGMRVTRSHPTDDRAR